MCTWIACQLENPNPQLVDAGGYCDERGPTQTILVRWVLPPTLLYWSGTCVTDGGGNPVAVDPAFDFFDPAVGIILVDPLDPGRDEDDNIIQDGSNIVIVTYVLQVPDQLPIGTVL